MQQSEVEIWKDVIGFESLYEISNFGVLKSKDKTKGAGNGYPEKGKVLKLKTDKDGYLVYGLCKESKKTFISLHRLVGIHFIDNPNNLPQINHRDGNKKNNIYSNLEWCTAKHNVIHSHKTGLVKKKVGAQDSRSKKILVISPLGTISEWTGIKFMCRATGRDKRAVQRCLKGEKENYNGYKFQYA